MMQTRFIDIYFKTIGEMAISDGQKIIVTLHDRTGIECEIE
jgi:hypothetical protein